MAALPPYASPVERAWHYSFRVLCALIFLFLIMPILVILPLSFNAEPYFTFNEEMLRLNPEAYSLRWYHDIFGNPQWLHLFRYPSTSVLFHGVRHLYHSWGVSLFDSLDSFLLW